MTLTFLLGGARSGKSSLAVKLGAEHHGPVAYVATCPRIDGDDDLDSRIDRHRAERPNWPTIEEPHDLGAALGRCDGDALVIVDAEVAAVLLALAGAAKAAGGLRRAAP